MKTLNAFLRCELPPTPRTELLSRVCFIAASISITCLMVVILSS